MEITRCEWAQNTFPAYEKYHDEEWGVPVTDDRVHFEFLILEGAQAGLSWSSILKRREGYRQAFAGFDPEAVAAFTDNDVKRLLADEGIIRNRLKVASAITNAKRFLAVQDEFGSFNDYIWRFVDGKPLVNQWKSAKEIPARSEISDALSKDLKKRGFSFVGSVIMYSHLQACGLINDHTINCFRYKELELAK